MSDEFTESDKKSLSDAVKFYANGKDPTPVIKPQLVSFLRSLLGSYEADYKYLMEKMTELSENIYELGYLNKEEIKNCLDSMNKDGRISFKESTYEFFDHFLSGEDIKDKLADFYESTIIPDLKKEQLRKQ